MKFSKIYLTKFLIFYVLLNILSYGLFDYYTEKYKKIDIIFYYPEIIDSARFAEFMENNFKGEFGNMAEIARSCYKLTLTKSNTKNSIIDFNDTKKTEVNFINYLYEKTKLIDPAERIIYEDESVDMNFYDFSRELCRINVNNPFKSRDRALFFVFFFNIIHAIFLINGYELIRSKNKNH